MNSHNSTATYYNRQRHNFFKKIDSSTMDHKLFFPDSAISTYGSKLDWDKSVLTDCPNYLWTLHSKKVMNCLSSMGNLVSTQGNLNFTQGNLNFKNSTTPQQNRLDIKIHQLYNMGTIIEFSDFTIGVDIIPGMKRYDCKWYIPSGFYHKLTQKLNLLCLSHMYDNNPAHPGRTWTHVDHCDIELMSQIIINNKINNISCPIIVPAAIREHLSKDIYNFIHNRPPRGNDFCYFNVTLDEILVSLLPSEHCQSTRFSPGHNINNTPSNNIKNNQEYQITTYKARHVYQTSFDDTPQNMYDIKTPNNKRILFLGDHDYTEPDYVPDTAGIDLLIAHYGGISPNYDDMNPNNPGDLQALIAGIKRFNPKRVLMSHVGEIGHSLGCGRESWALAYEDSIKAQKLTGKRVDLLFWGESLHL